MAQQPTYAKLQERIAALEEEVAELRDYKRRWQQIAAEKKETETALKDCRARYRELYKKAPIGIFQTTSDGRANFVNPHLGLMVAGELANTEKFLFTDITRLKQAEKNYRLLQFGLDSAAIGIFMIEEDGRIMYANNYACRNLGYSREELCRLTIFDIDPAFTADSWKLHRQRIRKKGSGTIESMHRRKDGQTFPVEVTVTYVQYEGNSFSFSFAQDISERRQIEDTLRKNEQLLEETQQLTKVGGWEYDVDTGRLFWTDEVFRIYEVSREAHDPNDIRGNLDFYAPEHREAMKEAFYRALHEGKAYDLEVRLITAAGRSIWVRTTATAEYRGGRVVRLVGNIMDISGQKEAEKERLKLENQLQQAQKMEAVGRLAGGISHDFNNLLSIVLGYSELLLDSAENDHPHREGLQHIHDAGERARSLTRQLLAFSRKQVLEIQSLDANNVVSGFKGLMQRVIGEDIELQLKLSPKPLYLKADVTQLEQVLMNLAINARDAMPAGGVLSIETAATELDAVYASRQPEVTPGPYVMISITDNGHGMDEKTRQRIFEPFFTTKETERGSGLGLATCYGIIRQHSGYIWVYSEQGEGTTFKIYIPCATEQLPAGTDAEAGADSDAGAAATILVVEDDPTVRKMTCEVLQKAGHRTISAEQPTKAIEMAQTHEETIHLLLTDVIMPEMKGPELCRLITAYHPQIRVLYMSGYTDNVIAHHGILEPDIHFIQKPFAVKNLAAKVGQVLSGT
ncbi:MAG: PAS domain S-box protein [Desulfosalsimonadaceae bacterium]